MKKQVLFCCQFKARDPANALIEKINNGFDHTFISLDEGEGVWTVCYRKSTEVEKQQNKDLKRQIKRGRHQWDSPRTPDSLLDKR